MRAVVCLVALAACADQPHHDGRGRGLEPVSPLLANKTERHMRAPLTIVDAQQTAYVVTHELAHADLDFVDEYTEDGLDGGVIALDDEWAQAAQLQQLRDVAPELRQPTSLTITLDSAVSLALEGVVPTFSHDPGGQHERVLLSYTHETQTVTGATDNILVGIRRHFDQTFGVANGTASRVVVVQPLLQGPQVFASPTGTPPPSAMPIHVLVAADHSGRFALESTDQPRLMVLDARCDTCASIRIEGGIPVAWDLPELDASPDEVNIRRGVELAGTTVTIVQATPPPQP